MDEVGSLARADERQLRALARRAHTSLARWRVLREASGGKSVSRIARALGLSRQSVQRIADGVVEAGLARFTANPDHARSPLLLPTEAGGDLVRSLDRRAALLREESAPPLEPDEIQTALLVLRSIRDHIRTR